MKTLKVNILFLILIIIVLYERPLLSDNKRQVKEKKILSLNQFVTLACKNNKNFQEILIQGLVLKYNKILSLPSKDIVLSVKGQYNYALTDDATSGMETTGSLSKLFPETGTEIYAGYSLAPSRFSTENTTTFQTYISQPIAKNAFGYETRLLKNILGIENTIARYQIVEAYEDFLASLLALYYQWYSDFENYKTAQLTYKQNKTLLNNIRARYYSRIAFRSDVDRIAIQTLEKEETLKTLKLKLKNSKELIYQAIEYSDDKEYIPKYKKYISTKIKKYDQAFMYFINKSRTARILRLLKRHGNKQIALHTHALLPSVNLLFGYTYEKIPTGSATYNRQYAYGGVQLDYPFGNYHAKSRRALAKINAMKTKLSIENLQNKLKSDIHNLQREILLLDSIIKIYKQKVVLSKRVLGDEQRRYYQGRLKLKDLIDAMNSYDEYRFKLINQKVKYSTLKVEYLRLTDQLVQKNSIKSKFRVK